MSCATAALLMAAAADDSSSEGDSVNQCITPYACFQNLTDTTVDYCIDTDWHITYHKKLRSALKAIDGYGPVDTGSDTFDHCGWNLAEGISKTQVDRGVIYYKAPSNASLSFRPTDLPSRIHGAVQILRTTYPSLEIGVILGFIGAAIVGFCVLCCCARPVCGAIGWGLDKVFRGPARRVRAVKGWARKRRDLAAAKRARSAAGVFRSSTASSEETLYEKV